MGSVFISILVIGLILTLLSIKIVPQQQAWILERLGKFNRVLNPGLNITIPLVDRVAYKHSLKERAVDVHEQTAITQDNVTLVLDGIVYLKIINPIDASYGVENPYYAVIQLAQTSMRSAIGKMHMDRTFEERESLNTQIVLAINEAASSWGIQCMRYEIKDIKPPSSIVKAMEMQVAAERQKRADILESEGKKQSKINNAEASKQEVVLNSEGNMMQQINQAKGEAEAILTVAKSTALSIEQVAKSIVETGGREAVSLKVAQQYVDAFASLAKKSNTLIIPANVNDISSMITQALGVFSTVSGKIDPINKKITESKK